MSDLNVKTILIYSGELLQYDFGPGHPFRKDRFSSFLELYEKLLGDNGNFRLVKNDRPCSDTDLLRWHSASYISVVKAASDGLRVPGLSRFVSQDNLNPVSGEFPKGIEKAARSVVKNSILAFDYLQNGEANKTVSIGGGLHHAKPDYGEGFCIYNDVVIATKYAIEKYHFQRILILDTDAHAGNGTCEAFYEDRRVLFIDLHQGGIYPGTGFVNEIGKGEGEGFTVNLPLFEGTSDDAYQLIFEEVIAPIAREFKPEIILRYGGSDPHPADRITQLGLTLRGFDMIAKKVRQLSAMCDNKVIDMVCSGYNPEVVSKVWLTLIAGLVGIDLELEEDYQVDSMRRLQETRELVGEVKRCLRRYWKCMN